MRVYGMGGRRGAWGATQSPLRVWGLFYAIRDDE